MAKRIFGIFNRKQLFTIAWFSGCVFILFTSFSLLMMWNVYRSFTSLDYYQGTIIRVEEMVSSLKEAESLQRGYILSGNPYVLKDYRKARERTVQAFRLVKLSPVDEALTDSLQYHINRRLEILELTRAIFEKEKKVTLAVLESFYQGQNEMKEVLRVQQKIYESGMHTLRRHKYFSHKGYRNGIYVIIGGATASMLVLTGILLTLKNEYNRKVIAEEELEIYQLQLEEQLARLNNVNAGLEQFAYAASHDLQEPLRKIIAFSERVQDKVSEYNNAQVNEYLDKLSHSAFRMRTLITDLLAYSKTAQLPGMEEEVDLDLLVKNVIEDLEEIISSKQAEIVTEKLSKVKGNHTQLRQLFQNLISNALKFTKPGVKPFISISGEILPSSDPLVKKHLTNSPVYPEYYIITVKDNGIGFEPEHQEQIFQIFHRLHGKDEYEGTGIGLALCKRIAENHLGFITARSKTGEGTTFITGLPVKEHRQEIQPI